MCTKIEDKYTAFLAHLKEIKSSMILLQNAVRNEFDETNLKDIDNLLEILNNKFNEITYKAELLKDEIFLNNFAKIK